MTTYNFKRVYCTSDQKRRLTQFVNNHKDLQSGKFTKEFRARDARALWEEITAILNDMPGSQKNWIKWRKTWQDMKTKNRKSKTMTQHTRSGREAQMNMRRIKEEHIDDDSRNSSPDLSEPISDNDNPYLTESVDNTVHLIDHNEAYYKMKKSYYEKKLTLMRADVQEKRRIANALELIAEAMDSTIE